ncbi:MAG: hypothetical protein JNJ63_07790 [Hyphomonadaceae bacterium]|nr:hypothetical protein [Hyphomonadaceae bacterium]
MADQYPNSAHALLDRDIQRVHKLAQNATAEGDVRFVRMAGWLIAGNAGALLLCFNALLDHKICDWDAFNPLVLIFVAGLTSAFASALFDWFALLLQADHLRKIARTGEWMQLAWVERDGLRERFHDVSETERKAVENRLLDIEKEVASQISSAADLKTRVWRHSAVIFCATAAVGLSAGLLALGVYKSVSDPRYLMAVCGSTEPSQ